MKVLMTDRVGFIGSNSTDYFLVKGDEVTVFDNLSKRNLEKNLNWVK